MRRTVKRHLLTQDAALGPVHAGAAEDTKRQPQPVAGLAEDHTERAGELA